MTADENGFFSDADNSSNSGSDYSNDSYSGYESPAPATESDQQTPQTPENNQPSEVEQLRQQLASQQQEIQNNARWKTEQDAFMKRVSSAFNPQQEQLPNNEEILKTWVSNPHEYRQQIENSAIEKATERATQAAYERMQYEMAEQQALAQYPTLSEYKDVIGSDANVKRGVQQFTQKNGRPPQTPFEVTQAAVDAFVGYTGAVKGLAPNQGQTQPGMPRTTIPLNVQGQNNSQEADVKNMTPEQFMQHRAKVMAPFYQ